ncbi:RHS repeat-associated core domain-containing protein [Kutzneria sp. NPDC052558]|uniref:RHS repeat-associated core domain-containing protein n=1 Tax=Kutzneria sp. NPDC052558 TaxID=3364121 RepID=UPI0037C8545D
MRHLLVVIAAVAGLIAGTLVDVPPPALATTSSFTAPSVPKDQSVPVHPVASHYTPPKAMPAWQPSKVTWPSGTSDVTLGAAAAKSAVAAGGSLPVSFGPAKAGAASAQAATAPVTAHVAVKPAPAGTTGLMVSVQRTDHAPEAVTTNVAVNYNQFRDAVGADWASRLMLVQLPDCALTTPELPQCRTQTPLASTNNVKTTTVSAEVTMPNAGKPMVVEAVAAASGGGGDFSATSLKPSGSWQAGGASDAFSWSYQMQTPAVPGGLVPKLGLSYNSQAVDGLSSSTNNQASWIGDGWSYEPGFVERSYQSCHQNPKGTTQTWDECWSPNTTLTLSLGGQTTTLVPDNTQKDVYHPQGDSNERVTHVPAQGGAGEQWIVATADGTVYYFGLNKLPGWTAGDATKYPTTNSVLSVPVYATAADQPCYNATFANSYCLQPYRWNLDYVVDAHSDALSYFYSIEKGHYARNLGTKADTDYDRASSLTKILYGQRDGQVYSTQPAAEVLFNSTGRCKLAQCADPSNPDNITTQDWPDTPKDLDCKASADCSSQAPTFYSTYMLSSIQTLALVGSTEQPVDQWTLSHSFPVTNSDTTPALWLDSIKRTGQDTSNSGSTAAIDLPLITFVGTGLANRVNANNDRPSITRQRLQNIVTETGEKITVNYNTSCGTPPTDPAHNTTTCYPAYWTPPGATDPVIDWFAKYTVHSVDSDDSTGGGTNHQSTTTYIPVGDAAWHYDDNPLTPTTPVNQRTWNQWRGYQGMIVQTGGVVASDPVMKTQYTYFQGMDGDILPSDIPTGKGTRPSHVADSRGDPAVTDSDQFSGMTYETQVFNGSSVISDTVTDPWSSTPTATHALTGLPALQAFQTGTADTKVYVPLADGTVRKTETDYHHDQYGRVDQSNDHGDLATTSDDLCSTTTYTDNTSPKTFMLDKVSEVKVLAMSCGARDATPADTVTDTRTFYDGATDLATPPTVGDVTQAQQQVTYNGGVPQYNTTTTTVDQYGRTLTVTDANGNASKTAYTPTTGAEPTAIVVTDPKSHTTKSTLDPLRDLTLSATDPAGYVTSATYDALGRRLAVNKPGITAAVKYSYTVANNAPSVVTTQTKNDNGSYRTSETLYDSKLRARETQTQTPDNGRVVTETFYNTNGLVSETDDPYFNSDPVSATFVQAPSDKVPSATGISYDGAGRKTASVANHFAVQTWQTTYAYGGNTMTTMPPTGTAATTAFTDARGNTTDVYRYHAGATPDPLTAAPSDYDHTRYTFYPSGKQASIVDPAGNTWSYEYDLAGHQTVIHDPDAGTTVDTYDPVGQLTTTTDARGKQTTMQYDEDGRKTNTYDTTGGVAPSPSNTIASWTYDKPKIGYPTSATSYSGGDVYSTAVSDYNQYGKPTAVTAKLTGEGTTIIPAAGLMTSWGYTATGNLNNINEPTTPGLLNEMVSYHYDAFGEPTGLDSSGGYSSIYVKAVGYSELGQPKQYTLPTNGGQIQVNLGYDSQTQALNEVQTFASKTSSAPVDDLTYSFSNSTVSQGAGLVVGTTDKQNGGTVTDQQCFAYDYASRLSAAWTSLDSCASTPKPGASSTVGGTSPYWQSWTYDAAGNRATQVDHDTSGNTSADTTTTYNYPTAGSPQSHTLTNTTATGPKASTQTASYTYDAAGNTQQITGGATGDQSLTWTNQGKLATDTTSTGGSSYVYDADGNLVVRRDPGQTTLFIGDQQIVLNKATNTVTTTRYYKINGQTVACRTGDENPQYLVPDRQGTDQLAFDSGSQALTKRQFLPFGQTRDSAPSLWPSGLGYVGGLPDPTTQLENLGAREYNPANGRFLSVDPVLEAGDQNQLNGYDYAGNNPVTGSDPSGLMSDPSGPACGTPGGVACWNPWGDGGAGGGGGGADSSGDDPPSGNSCSKTCGESPDKVRQGKARAAIIERSKPFWTQVKDTLYVPALLLGIVDAKNCVLHGDVAGCLWTLASIIPLLRPLRALDALVNAARVAAEADKIAQAATAAAKAAQAADDAAKAAQAATDAAADSSKAAEGAGDSGKAAQDAAGSCLANSFAGDTPVLMANGSVKPIRDVKVGDEVANAAPGDSVTQRHVVTAVHVTDTDTDFVSLSVTSPDGHKAIMVTAHHLFWNATAHIWTEAADLKVGDRLEGIGVAQVVVSGSWRFTSSVRTYNLSIDALHSYYVVVGDAPVLVHNDGQSDPSVFSNLYPEDTGGWTRVINIGNALVRTGNYQYVVLTDGTLLLGKGDGHIALTKGADVSAAGEVRIKSGRIREINNLSGHYKPYGSNAEASAVDAFNKAGFDATGKYVEHKFPEPRC